MDHLNINYAKLLMISWMSKISKLKKNKKVNLFQILQDILKKLIKNLNWKELKNNF